MHLPRLLKQHAQLAFGAVLKTNRPVPSPNIRVQQDTRVLLHQAQRGPLWPTLAHSVQQEVIAKELTILKRLALRAISASQAPNTRHNTHAHQAK